MSDFGNPIHDFYLFIYFEKTVAMLKNILAHFILWILFQPLAEIDCQVVTFKLRDRYSHTATLINNKLYILGGDAILLVDVNKNVGKEFFYLDVSVPFNAQNLLWQDLSSVNIVPSHLGATSVNGGANNNTLFLYGGNITTAELVYTFYPQSNSWIIPKISGVSTRKRVSNGIIGDNGKVYLWGGTNNSSIYQNDMLILDTINLSLGERSSGSLAPTPRGSYGATLLPNQKIIYIGE